MTAQARDSVRADESKGTGVIRGLVTSADRGRALRRAQVRVSGSGLQSPRTVSTGANGRYELRNMPPGRYSVSVTRTGYLPINHGERRPGERGKQIDLAEGQLAEIDFALHRTSAITGRVLDELGEPVGGARVSAFQQQFLQGSRRLVPVGSPGISDDTGTYRLLSLPPGKYRVMASSRETWPSEEDPTVILGYAPTYYAGTPSGAEAQQVTVGLGQEVSPIDIQLVPGRTATLRGVALSSSGTPLAARSIMLSEQLRAPRMMSMNTVGLTNTAADGKWSFENVPPGEYMLTMRTGGAAEQAELVVVVAGTDVDGLMIVAGAGGTLQGIVVTESGSPLTPPLDRIAVRGVSAGTALRFSAPGAETGRVGNGGRFELRAPVGPTIVTLTSLPDTWAVKSIELDGRDVAETPLIIRNGDTISGLRIVLTKQLSLVRGIMRRERTQEPADGTVIVFAADSLKWLEGSRMVAHTRPDDHGLYEVHGLPPGDYFAIALDYVQEGQWYDPEFLEDLKFRAKRFTLGGGETRQLDLIVHQ